MVHFPISIKWQAVGMFRAAKSIRWIAEELQVPKSCVSRWIGLFRRTGSVERKQGSGRPRKTSDVGDRLLVRLARSNPFSSAQMLEVQFNHRLSARSVYRRLREKMLRKYKPLKKPLLTPQNKRVRMHWAMARCHWREHQWNRVVWSDESRFRIYSNDGRIMVWRERLQRYNPRFVIPTVQGGGQSIHVWGAIWKGGRSRLIVLNRSVTAANYCNTLTRFFDENDDLPGNFIFQQDNAPPHKARITTDFLEERNVNVLPWPARSPDLNPIEHVWEIIKRRIRSRLLVANNLRELQVWVEEEWNNIPQHTLDHLVDSMPRRVRAVVQVDGGHTRY